MILFPYQSFDTKNIIKHYQLISVKNYFTFLHNKVNSYHYNDNDFLISEHKNIIWSLSRINYVFNISLNDISHFYSSFDFYYINQTSDVIIICHNTQDFYKFQYKQFCIDKSRIKHMNYISYTTNNPLLINDKQCLKSIISYKLSPYLIKKFCQDYDVPIPLYEPKYLNYYLNIFNNNFDSLNKFYHFTSLLNQYSNQEYIDTFNSCKEKIINYIQQQKFYSLFQLDYFSRFIEKLPKCNRLYQRNNNNQYFIKISLSDEYYQALKHFEIHYTSEDDLETSLQKLYIKFGMSHFLYAPNIQYKIFKSLNLKMIHAIQQTLLTKIWNHLAATNTFNINQLMLTSYNQIIIKIPFDIYQTILNYLGPMMYYAYNHDIKLCIETFQLKNLYKNIYVEHYSDNYLKFINVPNDIFMQVFKKYLNLPLNNIDLLRYNGSILEPTKLVEEF